MILLDGSYGEGGGQILRTALSLSVFTKQSFEIKNIRASRPNPGLKAQHLACIKSAAQLCNAIVFGAQIGSTHLIFEPKDINKTKIEIDIGTAGAITLLLQAILLPAFFHKKSISFKITGGTDVEWSPQINYFQEVFLPHIKKYCAKIDVKLIKRGYYPAGAGEVIIKIKPKIFATQNDVEKQLLANAPKIILEEQGSLMFIKGISHACANLFESGVAQNQAASAIEFLKKKFSCPINITTEYSKSQSLGFGICLWAIFSKIKDDIDVYNPIILGADVIGKDVSEKNTGLKCAQMLEKTIKSGFAVDNYLADQLIPWIALIKGSKIKPAALTPHLKANIYATELFLGKCIKINEKENIIESF